MQAVEESPAGAALAAAGVQLASVDELNARGSRGERIVREAPRFYQRYLR